MSTVKALPVNSAHLPQENEFLRSHWQACSDVVKRLQGDNIYHRGMSQAESEIVLLADHVIQAFDTHYSLRYRMIAVMAATKHEERALNALGAQRDVDNDKWKHLDVELEIVRNAQRLAESLAFDRLAEYAGDNK
jgi:hypothetical protein